MDVGVFTFHRCINYGSYWQARCLVEGLRGLGHNAELLDHDAPEIRRAEWRNAFQPQLPVRTAAGDLRAYGRKARKFLDAFDTLPQSPRFSLHEPAAAGCYDAVVIGSDEVWNFRHPWYAGKPIFWGEGLATERLTAYAASFGSYDADDGLDLWWADKLRRIDALSVRDANSRRLVEQGTGIDPPVVLDPCLQFPRPVAANGHGAEPYLALYGHGFPDWFADAVRRWADSRGRRIISLGYRNDWADAQWLDAGPEDFPAFIANADAVATNFFHGCVFALIHGRPFVSSPSAYRRNKVGDLVRLLGAERHLVDEATPDAEYADLLGSPLASTVGERISAMRERSGAFLAAALG